ncbi:MAG: hypothetical protein LBH19_13635 [Dysgonamonadaceae bacterium]|jgi:hypothetical protein|nr:hypothetical protein [Dysgonamonadaceae bacterium]
MKRKTFLGVALFLATSGTCLFGQVHIGAIGDNDDPHPGAVLDLTNSSSRGLKLPMVALQNAEILQVDGKPDTDEDLTALGMTVYNQNRFALDGAGVYVWDGNRWSSVYAHGKEGVEIPAPVCSQGDIPSVAFAPYNLGANADKIDSIAIADNISKTKAYIRCSAVDFDAVVGDMYQWGRVADGHEKRNSQVVDISKLTISDYDASTGQITNASYKNHFIANDNSPYDWQKSKNDNLWGNGVKIDAPTNPSGVPYTNGHYFQSTAWQIPFNNPCPSGFRVPTQDELERIVNYDCNPSAKAGNINTSTACSYPMPSTGLTWVRVKDGKASTGTAWYTGDKTGYAIYKTTDWNAAGSDYRNGTNALYEPAAPEPLLFLPAAGARYPSGNITTKSINGCYMSSSVVGNNDLYGLRFYVNQILHDNNQNKVYALSIRCVAE